MGNITYKYITIYEGFPHSSVGKESASACNAGDLGSLPELGRSPGGENGNSRQYYCIENPMDRGVWNVTVNGVSRVGHDLATKPPPSNNKFSILNKMDKLLATYKLPKLTQE